jgi:hypothetical protein
MLCRVTDLEEFFGTTKATENGYKIWNSECEEFPYVKFFTKRGK